jgi:hypothetical protein
MYFLTVSMCSATNTPALVVTCTNYTRTACKPVVQTLMWVHTVPNVLTAGAMPAFQS